MRCTNPKLALLTTALSTLSAGFYVAHSQTDAPKIITDHATSYSATSSKVVHPSSTSIGPFLKQYCIKCHGEEKQKGQMRFDTIDWNVVDNDTAQRWQDMLDQLNGGDMPPEDEKQPQHKELKDTIATLTHHVDKARITLADHRGEIKLRRLNRREYINSVNQLLGFKIPEKMLPEDVESENFDTVGSDQMFTSLHFETYLDAGRKASSEALKWLPRPHLPAKIHRHDPSAKVVKKYTDIVTKGDRQMAQKKAGGSWKEMGFKDAGEAEILFRQFWVRVDLPRKYLQLPKVKEGVYLTTLSNGRDLQASIHVDQRANYKFRIRGGYVGNPIEERKLIRLENLAKKYAGTFKFTAPANKPEVIETTLEPNFGPDARHRIIVWKNYEGMSRAFDREVALGKAPLLGKRPWSPVWVDWLEFEGPFYPKAPSLFEKLLFPKGRSANAKVTILNDKRAKQLIEKFAYQAFRRQQPEKAYIDKLYQYFTNSRASGKKYKEVMAEVMAIVLSSPKFLYIVESSDLPNGKKPLSNRQLAIRLSYFLWSSAPDEQLYAANLSNTQEFEKQVDRLLADRRSTAFRDGFISQWAELERYDAITVDKKIYKNFNLGIRHSARQEITEFFGTLINENLPVKNLIDSNFVTINHALASHYGLKSNQIKGQQFSKVTLPKGSPRGGLTTQTAFLTLGSNGERSSPVIRGAFLMEKLLHDKPKPPPPNVPELGSATNKPLTNRQLVKLHQNQRICASCHQKMDAIGFGLENFDAIGRWRNTELVHKKQVVINPASALPNGEKFTNVQELKSLLIKEKDHLAAELVESIMSYALGRTIQFSDQVEVNAILRKLKDDDYKMRSLIKAVVLSPKFNKK